MGSPFLPGRSGGGGGGGGGGPDGTLPTFTAMTALDAGLTAVGRMAQLVGAATGAVILTARRVAAGAGGLEILGPIQLWQASGTELDGAWALATSAGGDPTWGTPGSESTGGLILTTGYAALPGWRPLRTRTLALSARMVAVTLPGSPATGDGACVGAQAVAAARARLGGFGYQTTFGRSAVALNADTTVANPTLTLGGTSLSVAAGALWDTSLGCPIFGTTLNPQGLATRVDGSGSNAIARATPAATTGGDAADYRPIFWARNMTARFTHLSCGEFA